MTWGVGVVAILLLLGIASRQRLPVFRRYYIPASVIAGFIGLGSVTVIQAMMPEARQAPVDALVQTLAQWPGPLIAVVFATMMLQLPRAEQGALTQASTTRRVTRQGLMVWIIVLGETAVGLLATWLLIQPRFDVPNSIGMLIETGFAGGHGTAAAMGQVFQSPEVGLPAGEGLGMLMATCGLVFGLVSGIAWINVAGRFGWVRRAVDEPSEERDGSLSPIGYRRISEETVDPLLLQIVWIGLAVGIGMFLQFCVLALADGIDSVAGLGQSSAGELVEAGGRAKAELAKRLTFRRVVDFPLFIYTLFGGYLVRKGLSVLGQEQRIDTPTIQRLSSSSMEVLVVAAITSLKLSLIAVYAGPLLILFCVGAVWTSICLMLLSRWILPREHWFELGLINYGMSTGTTATGFVLLRMVDPSFRTAAASDYALAAQLSAPFIGGGVLTIALPLLVLERVPIAWPALVIGLVVALLIALGIWLRRRDGDSAAA